MPQRIPYEPTMFDGLSLEQKQALYEQAAVMMSDQRRQLFDRLAPLRTRHVSVVLEDVYQSHNAAAVLRSCDCFGVQDVHVVENHNAFNPAGDVAVGSSKWVDWYRHGSIQEAYSYLRQQGYRIVATMPHENDQMIGDLDITQPVALVFGTELTGLTADAVADADAYVKIPMYGFTESFNISVSVALSLFSLTERLRRISTDGWGLTEGECLDLKLRWAAQTIRDGEKVMRKLMGN